MVIGIDYGTDSVRIVLVDAADGSFVAESVAEYPRWKRGLYCDPAASRFRQHPLDYIESLESAMAELRRLAPAEAWAAVKGLCVDTTGSTPGPVDASGLPLALTERFAEDPDAMFWLWKDHTATPESDDINRALALWNGPDFARFSGGAYSPEWFWSKLLRALRYNPAVRGAAATWVEHSDWMPAWLAGNRDAAGWKRNVCAAGHKALWHAGWGGLPSEEFLASIDPLLAGLRGRLYTETVTAETVTGQLDAGHAARWGLPAGIVIAAGAIDAHVGAVGGGIGPGDMLKIMGTSTCDMIVAEPGSVGGRAVKGICGQVDGSILPGYEGLEAGQSAFGDAYAWLRDFLVEPARDFAVSVGEAGARGAGSDGAGSKRDEAERFVDAYRESLLPRLSERAAALPLRPDAPIALDWLNGRRTPDVNHSVKGAFAGLDLGTSAVEFFAAIVEATAFGSRRILERFEDEGVHVGRVIATGGVAKKSPYAMQVVADAMRRPVIVAAAGQTVALGAAMLAAVAAGLHPSLASAQAAMGAGVETVYEPDPVRADHYDGRYKRYLALGAFSEEYSRTGL